MTETETCWDNARVKLDSQMHSGQSILYWDKKFWLKNVLCKKNLSPKVLKSNEIILSKKNLGPQKFCVQKNV